MSEPRLTLAEYEDIIGEHAQSLRSIQGVTAFGIAKRDDKVRFVVAAADEATRNQVIAKFPDRRINGYELHFETENVRSIAAVSDPSTD